MLANSQQEGVSRPCQWLAEQDRLVGPILDWGCGNGDDVVFMRNAYGYDPQHQPDLPEQGELFNTVLCTYFLDTIPEYHDRCLVIAEALQYLFWGGWLYVAITRDDNLMTDTTNSRQDEVSEQLKVGGFTLIRSTGDTEIWAWHKTP